MATVDIEINESDVLEKVKEEISRVAASAYDGDGQSLYESIMVYSRDTDDLKRLFNDARSRLTERSRDILVRHVQAQPEEVLFGVLMVPTGEGKSKMYYFKNNPPIAAQDFKDEDGVVYVGSKGTIYNEETGLYRIRFFDDGATISREGYFDPSSEPELMIVHPELLQYNLPDFNVSLLPMVSADVERFLVQHITAQWLVGKRYQRAEEFVAHANVVLEETIHHLKIRKPVNQRIGL